MKLPPVFGAIKELADRLTNQPCQGQAMLVGHLL